MDLSTIKSLMSPEMFAEVSALAKKEPAELEIEIVHLNRGGYANNGKYFGALAIGERIHRVDTEYGTHYIRSCATSYQIKRALGHGKSVALTPPAVRLLKDIGSGNDRVFSQSEQPYGWIALEKAGLAVRVEGASARARLTNRGSARFHAITVTENDHAQEVLK